MEAQARSTDAVMSPNDRGVRAGAGSRPEAAATAATAPRFDPRTRVLREGPIVPAVWCRRTARANSELAVAMAVRWRPNQNHAGKCAS
jgi:hypothetical protein